MAFSVAECIASLEWQIVNYFYQDIEKMPLWFEIVAIIMIYGSAIFGIWKLLRPRITDKHIKPKTVFLFTQS